VPEGTGPIKGIAFALAIGVFLDAFLVRMTLVPAAMALAGDAAWWLPRWLSRILPNVDIEGEGLRHHLADKEWATGQTHAITAEGTVFGLPESPFGPLDLAVDAGTVVVMTGSATHRRVIAATLAGRLDPVFGRLQVQGAPLPSERTRALRMVALADVGDSSDNGLTVGELLAERLDLAHPWYRAASRRSLLSGWVERLNAALGSGRGDHAAGPIRSGTSVSSLSALERAAVLVAAALTENPGIVIVDLGEGLPVDPTGRDLVQVLATLAPASTTLILGAASFPDAAPAYRGARPLQTLHLDSRDRSSLDGASSDRKALQR
jgi:RND superfamily putative drug exporter